MTDNHEAKIFRWVGRTIGLIGSLFFFAMIVGDTIVSIQKGNFEGVNAEVMFILVPVIIAIAGFVISWWLERPGAIVLIAGYVILSITPSIHSLYVGRGFIFFADMWLYSLPFLIAGISLLISNRLSARAGPAG